MNTKNLRNSLVSFTGVALLASFIALPAGAQGVVGVSASVDASASAGAGSSNSAAMTTTSVNATGAVKTKAEAALITRGIGRGDKEIDRRVASLNQLVARVGTMVRLTADQKASISTQLQAQVTALTSLKAKIDADSDTATLKADVKSILDSYRVFALVIPQGHIVAASDRMSTIIDSMTTIGAKLQARIAAAKAAGKVTVDAEASLADFSAKLADAKLQAQAAQAGVAALVPDQGDKASADANKAALVKARADIKVGTTDLKAARKDADAILKTIKSFKLDASATASSTTSVQQ